MRVVLVARRRIEPRGAPPAHGQLNTRAEHRSTDNPQAHRPGKDISHPSQAEFYRQKPFGTSRTAVAESTAYLPWPSRSACHERRRQARSPSGRLGSGGRGGVATPTRRYVDEEHLQHIHRRQAKEEGGREGRRERRGAYVGPFPTKHLDLNQNVCILPRRRSSRLRRSSPAREGRPWMGDEKAVMDRQHDYPLLRMRRMTPSAISLSRRWSRSPPGEEHRSDGIVLREDGLDQCVGARLAR